MRNRVRLVVAFGLALVLAGVAWAQYVAQTKETVTFSTSAVGFTASTLIMPGGQQAEECTGVLETAKIRELHNGQVPTSTVGTPIEVGSQVTIRGHVNLEQFKGIRDSTASVNGTIQFQCAGLK